MTAFYIAGGVLWAALILIFITGLCKAAGKPTPKVGERE